LVLLVARGLLLNRGPRRRLAIAPPPAVAVPPAVAAVLACRPLVLVGAEPTEVNAAVLLSLRDLEQRCREQGTRCHTVDLSGLPPARKAAVVRRALLEHKPTHVLMVYCDQSTYELLAAKSCRLAAIGGNVIARKVDRLTADLPLLAMAAFDDLRKLGHRRFRLVMLGLGEAPEDAARLRDYAASARVEASGVWGGTLDLRAMSAALAAALRDGVTAFAFPRPEALVLALAYFDSVEVRVPRDVSVVLLLSGPYDFMHARQPAHFSFRKQAILDLMMRWFEFGEVTSARFTREVAAHYVRGRTVGPVRRR
jgi:DNA-binding LacI/PurR family transcriptional regulator